MNKNRPRFRLISRWKHALVSSSFHVGQDCEVPGRFSRGKLTSGDIWTLDPYSNEVLLTEIRGDKLSDDLKDVLERRDIPFDPDRRYQVAGLDFHVTHFEEHYGNILSQENTGTTMRETLTAYVKKHGLHI